MKERTRRLLLVTAAVAMLGGTGIGDGNYVYLAGTQTITGNKTFTGSVTFSGAVTGGGAVYGNSGQKEILIVPINISAQTATSATAQAVGAVSLNPSDYTLATGTGFDFSSQSITLRVVAATGNTTVTGHVQLYDLTAAVSIKTFNFTNQTTEAKSEQALSTAGSASANTLATADHILEIRIYVDSPSLATDTLTLFSAEIRFINTV